MKTTISLPHLSIASLDAYNMQLQRLIAKRTTLAEHSEDALATLVAVSSRFSDSISTPRKVRSNKTKADRLRDRAFLHFKHRLLAELYSSDTATLQHAASVMQVLKKIGVNLYNRKNIFETMDIELLVDRLTRSENQPSLAALGLEEAVANLTARNNEFNSLVEQQRAAVEKLKKLPSPTAMRRELESAIRNAWKYVDAQIIINPNTGWEDVKTAIGSLNGTTNSVEKRRLTFLHKRKAKAKAQRETPKE